MKLLPVVAMILVLSGCAGTGMVQTSMNYNGQSMHSMDLADPHFYMDDDARGSNGPASPVAPRYAPDPFCGPNC